jgi:hypothetical protein
MTETAPMPEGLPPSQHWVVDKRLNLGFIFAVFLQTIGLVVYITKIDSRVGDLETWQLTMQTQVATSDKETRDISTRLARLEERTTNMLEILKDIKRYVDSRGKDAN